ncbi:MAG: glycosyltransferase family 4 protein [Candidatus Lambdaproteobacteria bacterium]|nr:glycosyltransferase family 4 protein [Candidatus Lambdaproteobacteria bacterium]
MNLLLSSCTHWWNAEAAYAAVLGETLQAAGHRVILLAPPGTRNAAQLAGRGLRVETAIPLHAPEPWRRAAALGRLAALQARERIEIVDVFRAAELPWHLLAARARPGLRVIRTRGNARPVRGHWLNRKLYGAWCDGVVAAAEVARRELELRLGVAPERLRTIYYPVATPPPASDGRTDGRRRLLVELGETEERILLAVVGRIAPEKGHALLLEALARLVPRHPALLLLVYAKSYPGEERALPPLQAQARALGLERHVRWLGFREDIRRLMGWVDLGVVPSIASEINCRVTVEFFSVATPVVACPTGALPEVIEPGRSGALADAATPAALAAALEPLLADDAARARLGQGAREVAEHRFSPGRFLAAHLELFEQALARPQGLWGT